MNGLSFFLSPIRWIKCLFFNAILQKELRSSGRRRSTYIIRGCYAALFAVVTLLAVSTLMSELEYESATTRAQSLTGLAESMVLFAVWFQFIMIALFSPAMTSSAICEEKLRGTLAALVTTPLTMPQIVLGKLAGRMYQVVILILISAPLLLAIRVFGGVPIETIVAFTSVTMSIAIFGGSFGLMFSMWHTRSSAAAVFAMLTMGLIFATPPIVFFMLDQNNYRILNSLFGMSPGQFQQLIPYGMAACPPITLDALASGGPVALGIPFLAGTVFDRIWIVSVLYLLLGSVLVLAVASRSLRGILQEDTGSVSSIESSSSSKSGSVSSRKIAKLGSHPIYWRESSRAWIENRFQRIILYVVVVALFGAAYLKTDLSNADMHVLMAFSALGVLALCAGVMTTGSVSGEREAGTWEVLVATPMSGGRIIFGKYFAVLRRLVLIAAAFTMHFVVMSFQGHIPWAVSAMLVTLIVTPPVLYLATGMLFGLVLRKGSVSSVCNIGLILTVWVAIPLVALLLIETAVAGYESTTAYSQWVHGTSPMGLIGSILDDIYSYRRNNSKYVYTLGSADVSLGTIQFVVYTLGAAHVLLAAAVLWLSTKVFQRSSGRSS